MAITVTLDSKVKGRFFSGSEKVRRGTLNLGTYATGGIAIAASDVQLKSLDELIVLPSSGYFPEWDKTNGKVKAYYDNANATYLQNQPNPEVANSANLAAINFRFRAAGK